MEEKVVGQPIMAMASIPGDVNATAVGVKQCITVAIMVVQVVIWIQLKVQKYY